MVHAILIWGWGDTTLKDMAYHGVSSSRVICWVVLMMPKYAYGTSMQFPRTRLWMLCKYLRYCSMFAIHIPYFFPFSCIKHATIFSHPTPLGCVWIMDSWRNLEENWTNKFSFFCFIFSFFPQWSPQQMATIYIEGKKYSLMVSFTETCCKV